MKILVNGDIDSLTELSAKLNFVVESYENDTVIITFPEGAKLKENPIGVEQLSGMNMGFPAVEEYVASSDNSLKNFITVGETIIASGNIEPVENLPYDYMANGKFRVYGNKVITTYNYILSGENDISEYYNYLELMLTDSTVIEPNSPTKGLK